MQRLFCYLVSMQHLLQRWRSIWNPNMYHGWGKRKRYFEGWYFKLVDPAETHVLAVIPGISIGAEGQRHAFIQLLDGKQCQTRYLRFPAIDFRPSGRRFELHLGDNYFAADRLRLALPEVSGTLHFQRPFPWPKMLGAPGIMGWYSFVPFMECYHGVVSMHHELEGDLHIGGRTVAFTGGRGYAEKDWGRSFPSSWIWMQSNHFEGETAVSLMTSVARIPWLNGHFIGYIVGLLLDGRLFRFATYTGARMKAAIEHDEVRLQFRDRRYRLAITARPGAGGDLLSPLSGEMTGKVNESMQGTIRVELFEGDALRFAGTGRNAGLEVAGPAEELLTADWRR